MVQQSAQLPLALTLTRFDQRLLQNNSSAQCCRKLVVKFGDFMMSKRAKLCVCVCLGAIAATVFIIFLLALYAVLWKCMVSPPKR